MSVQRNNISFFVFDAFYWTILHNYWQVSNFIPKKVEKYIVVLYHWYITMACIKMGLKYDF